MRRGYSRVYQISCLLSRWKQNCVTHETSVLRFFYIMYDKEEDTYKAIFCLCSKFSGKVRSCSNSPHIRAYKYIVDFSLSIKHVVSVKFIFVKKPLQSSPIFFSIQILIWSVMMVLAYTSILSWKEQSRGSWLAGSSCSRITITKYQVG